MTSLPDTSADMAQPTTGQADTVRASAMARGSNSDGIKYPYSVIDTQLPFEIQRRLLPGKCPVQMA